MPPAGTPQGAIETCSKSASRMIQDALPCVQNLGVDDTKKKSWWPSSQNALFRFQNMQCSAESGPEPEWQKPLGTNSQMKPKLHVAVPKADKWVIPLAASHNLGKLNIIECLSILIFLCLGKSDASKRPVMQPGPRFLKLWWEFAELSQSDHLVI